MIAPSDDERRPLVRLALEDGSVFTGRGFGRTALPEPMTGEVVFNTAMVGYQESLSDPSYSGQILVMTNPMIGNYGVAAEDLESGKPQITAFVVKELSRRESSYRAIDRLSAWLDRAGVPGIEGVDTRALVRRIRTTGALRGAIAVGDQPSDQALVALARQAPDMNGQNLAALVSCGSRRDWHEGLGVWAPLTREPDAPATTADGRPLRVVTLDCGAKHNMLRHLRERGCEIVVVPFNSSADDLRATKADGLFISNGPGDPAAVQEAIDTLREVAGELPTFGICLGHQLLTLALGASTYKLKYGHRGANQPVRNVLTGHVEITSQNHGFCVEPESLEGLEVEVTHVHLNDGTIAGFRHRTKPILAVQYHPESSPGPHDSVYLFDCFVTMMRTGRPISGEEMRRAQERWFDVGRTLLATAPVAATSG